MLVSTPLGCATAQAPGPQRASFPSGERTTDNGPLALELSRALYDLRQVSLSVTLQNRGAVPLTVDREGILLAYGELEYPVASTDEPAVPERTTLEPGASIELELSFVTEQPLLEAATLHVASIHREANDWLAPLRLTVPPSSAFVDYASPPEADEP